MFDEEADSRVHAGALPGGGGGNTETSGGETANRAFETFDATLGGLLDVSTGLVLSGNAQAADGEGAGG